MKEECDASGPCYALRSGLRSGVVYRVAQKGGAAVRLQNGARLVGCPWCLCDTLDAVTLSRWPWPELAPQPVAESEP